MKFIITRLIIALLFLSITGHVQAVSIGKTNEGVFGPDSVSGVRSVLFSPVGFASRLTLRAEQAEKFCIVIHKNGQWYYYQNDVEVPFQPIPSDVIVAGVDFSTDNVFSLQGFRGQSHGVQVGYTSGDLVILPHQEKQGGGVDGFSIKGTKLQPNPPSWWLIPFK